MLTAHDAIVAKVILITTTNYKDCPFIAEVNSMKQCTAHQVYHDLYIFTFWLSFSKL